MKDIERTPILQGLERFAQALPPEHRAELFRTAEAFLNVGVSFGIFTGLEGAPSKGDKQEQYMRYLQRKAAEYSK